MNRSIIPMIFFYIPFDWQVLHRVNDILDNVACSQDELVAYAKRAVVFFWEPTEGLLSALPGSVTGKLGGPSQRRLSETMTCHVLQAVSCAS